MGVHTPRGFGDVPDAHSVDREGSRWVGLACIDGSPGRGVDDRRWSEGGDRTEDLLTLGDVKVSMAAGHNVMINEHVDELSADLTVGSRD
jgi:hypothetical protein